ncbi:MAG: iron ABC transporter permease, partial [Deltaproteobacteria bacterium]|nr:iron ABC transporter permease [Deltaproteobacteria bacterium]
MRSIRPQLVILITGGLLLLFGLWGVAEGPADISLAHVVGVLAKACGLSVDATWPAWVESVVLQIRLPRIITGMFVGAALGLSGATLQGLFRNALAEPSIIGISSGASLGAVLAIYFGLAALSVWSIPVMAFLGASLTTFAVYSIATDRGHTPTETLLLAGVAIGALNTAISAFVMAMALSRWEVGQQILFWSMGGLEGRTWEHALLIAPTV